MNRLTLVPLCSTALILTAALLIQGTVRASDESSAREQLEEFSGKLDESLPLVRSMIERYREDQGLNRRRLGRTLGQRQLEAWSSFYERWLDAIHSVDFDSLDQPSRIDYLLMVNHLRSEQAQLQRDQQRRDELKDILPFADQLLRLQDAQAAGQSVSGREAAEQLSAVEHSVDKCLQQLDADELTADSAVAYRALSRLGSLRRELDEWADFYRGYDPIITWWIDKPQTTLREKLEEYQSRVRQKWVVEATGDSDPVVGDPIGRDALVDALRFEMIPYSPEELVDIAEREFQWCETEFRRAAAELGFGDDWKQALEHVKDLHVEPGQQPALIRQLAAEAVEFLDQRQLITIPPFCRESWRVEMMSAERQRVNPYFTGGEVISVSFPTSEMDHEDKLMSMRGNNIHFSRATVHHELIPGHHLQLYMADRYRTHRQLFRTPFFVEGWALYWEMLLWDLDFPQSPEDRVGMLFWRTHRCARIIFSLQYHLGNMTAEECIDFLVDRVGHERRNARAEVRRSIEGSYSPLYQAAYMLGGLQLRALHGQLVGPQLMTDREFHDAVLRENAIPIEMIRASLLKVPLQPDYQTQWRFYDP